MKGARCKKFSSVLVTVNLAYAIASQAFAAGVAAVKEQKFHSDTSASTFYFTELKDSGAPFIKFICPTGVVTIDKEKFAGQITLPNSVPDQIASEEEIAGLRSSVKDIEAFSKKFPKSEILTKAHLANLRGHVKQFDDGKIRYNSKWITKSEFAEIKNQIAEAEKKQKIKNAEIEAELARKKADRQNFEKSQREKGLAEYNDQWLPIAEVEKRVEEDAKLNKAAAIVNSKTISNAVYRIFQASASESGLLVEVLSGEINQEGINASLIFLQGALKGGAADGDYYKGNLFWCGSYSYETLAGLPKTVNRYSLDQNEALAIVKNSLFGQDEKSTEKVGKTVSGPETEKPKLLSQSVLEAAKSSGSGFFVGSDGHIVTNAHVIESAKSIQVYFKGEKHSAEIIKVSKVADLAILKIPIKQEGLLFKISESSPGQEVYALGYPQPNIQGVDLKITKGIISSSQGINEDETRFQIDAAVQPGNSGGPLCDTSGHLVGVVVASLNSIAVAGSTGAIPQNVNYAIKGSEVAALLRTKGIEIKSQDKTTDDRIESKIKSASECTVLILTY